MERAEKIGLGIATAGHVMLFGILSVGFLSTPNPLKLRTPPIEVSIVDEVGLEMAAPKLSQEEMRASQAPELGPTEEATPAPPKLEPVPEPAPAPPPKQAAPAPKPAEKAKPKPAPPKKAAPEKAKPKAEPEKQPRGSRLGADFLRGIETERPTKATADTPPATKMSSAQVASLNAEIRRQLKPHWKAPTGADAELLRTVLQVELNPDGSLKGTPQVVDQTGITESNRAQLQLHAEQAVKAVRLAAPFRLPRDFYDIPGGWHSLTLGFDRRLSQ